LFHIEKAVHGKECLINKIRKKKTVGCYTKCSININQFTTEREEKVRRKTCIWMFFLSCLFEFVELSVKQVSQIDDNEFAEFEEFDVELDASVDADFTANNVNERETPPVDTASIGAKRSPAYAEQKRNDAPNSNFNDDDYGIVEDESVDDFSHLLDENEFENFPDERKPGKQNAGPSKTVTQLKITDTKNHSLAVAWFDSNRPFLEENFSIVGDDGISPEVTKNVLIKESDNHYIVWCSGRQGCIGMEIHLKLIKRQDLLSLIFYIIRPKFDVIEIKIILNPEEMDPFVFALGTKRSAIKNSKEIMDLNLYCSEKKNVEKLGLPSSYILHSEIGEVTTGLIDTKIVSALCKYKDVVDYIHISDQFVGIKPIEMENMTKPPETAKVVMICLNIPGQLRATEEDVSSLQPLMIFIFHVLEKVRRFRLTREGKQKADKNRQYVEESFLKTTHAQRQEAAQQRREERARERKERLMAEEDPERQRKLEKQELKRELKKKQPRVKQIKIKAM
ncbi:Coiled-coil domain-containing protein 47, partial [Trichinella sp. T6]